MLQRKQSSKSSQDIQTLLKKLEYGAKQISFDTPFTLDSPIIEQIIEILYLLIFQQMHNEENNKIMFAYLQKNFYNFKSVQFFVEKQNQWRFCSKDFLLLEIYHKSILDFLSQISDQQQLQKGEERLFLSAQVKEMYSKLTAILHGHIYSKAMTIIPNSIVHHFREYLSQCSEINTYKDSIQTTGLSHYELKDSIMTVGNIEHATPKADGINRIQLMPINISPLHRNGSNDFPDKTPCFKKLQSSAENQLNNVTPRKNIAISTFGKLKSSCDLASQNRDSQNSSSESSSTKENTKIQDILRDQEDVKEEQDDDEEEQEKNQVNQKPNSKSPNIVRQFTISLQDTLKNIESEASKENTNSDELKSQKAQQSPLKINQLSTQSLDRQQQSSLNSLQYQKQQQSYDHIYENRENEHKQKEQNIEGEHFTSGSDANSDKNKIINEEHCSNEQEEQDNYSNLLTIRKVKSKIITTSPEQQNIFNQDQENQQNMPYLRQKQLSYYSETHMNNSQDDCTTIGTGSCLLQQSINSQKHYFGSFHKEKQSLNQQKIKIILEFDKDIERDSEYEIKDQTNHTEQQNEGDEEEEQGLNTMQKLGYEKAGEEDEDDSIEFDINSYGNPLIRQQSLRPGSVKAKRFNIHFDSALDCPTPTQFNTQFEFQKFKKMKMKNSQNLYFSQYSYPKIYLQISKPIENIFNKNCGDCERSLSHGIANFVWKQTYRCSYTGLYYCKNCFGKQQRQIPWRIRENWDFTQYPVSIMSARKLDSAFPHPVIEIQYNQKIVQKNNELFFFLTLRRQIYLIYDTICNTDAFEDLVGRKYMNLAIKPNLFSIKNLNSIHNGELTKFLSEKIFILEKHMHHCDDCLRKSYVCLICQSTEKIFVHDIFNTEMHPNCKRLYHKYCLTSKNCKICQRGVTMFMCFLVLYFIIQLKKKLKIRKSNLSILKK